VPNDNTWTLPEGFKVLEIMRHEGSVFLISGDHKLYYYKNNELVHLETPSNLPVLHMATNQQSTSPAGALFQLGTIFCCVVLCVYMCVCVWDIVFTSFSPSGASRWSPEDHKFFPEEFKKSVLAFLMICGYNEQRKPFHPESIAHALPKELQLKIIEYAASDHGIYLSILVHERLPYFNMYVCFQSLFSIFHLV